MTVIRLNTAVKHLVLLTLLPSSYVTDSSNSVGSYNYAKKYNNSATELKYNCGNHCKCRYHIKLVMEQKRKL